MAYPEITSETIDSLLNTAGDYVVSGNLIEAERYALAAKIKVDALPDKEEAELREKYRVRIAEIQAGIAKFKESLAGQADTGRRVITGRMGW